MSTAVVDGIRVYWNPVDRFLNLFRLDDHMNRFAQARRFQRMQAPWFDEELNRAVVEVLQVNGFAEDAYVAPSAFIGIDATQTGGGSMGQECHVANNIMPARIKCIANYHNYRLFALDVQGRGCEHFFAAIMLTQLGKVSEGAMASLFMVRRGVMVRR